MVVRRECRRIAALLWDYAALRLPEIEIERIEAHLQVCPDCRKQAEQYRQTTELIRAYRNSTVPASLTTWNGLLHHLESGRQPAVSRTRRGLPFYALGAAAIAGAVLMLMIQGSGHSGPVNPGSTDNISSKFAQRNPVVPASGEPGVTKLPPVTPVNTSGEPRPSFAPNKEPNKLVQVPPGIRWDGSTHHPRWSNRVRHEPAPQIPEETPSIVSTHPTKVIPVDYSHADGPGHPSQSGDRNFVMTPVAYSADQDSAPHYVIGSIASQHTDPASSEGDEEARGW